MAMGALKFENDLRSYIKKHVGYGEKDMLAMVTPDKVAYLYDFYGGAVETAFKALDLEYTENCQVSLWDHRFLRLAEEIARWSKDPSTKTGALFVAEDHRIVGEGHNDFPAKMEDKPEWWNNREEKYKRVIHAEMNAAQNCREVPVLRNSTLYTWPFMPCSRCATHMIGFGIGRVVAPIIQPGSDQERWTNDLNQSQKLFDECGVQVTLYDIWNTPF